MATVLVVDPDPETLALLELVLRRLGHLPIGEADLETGVEPDLLLLEPAAPLALQTARRMRARLPSLPVVCVSIEPPGEASRGLDPAGYLMKPFRRPQLAGALDRALARPRG